MDNLGKRDGINETDLKIERVTELFPQNGSDDYKPRVLDFNLRLISTS